MLAISAPWLGLGALAIAIISFLAGRWDRWRAPKHAIKTATTIERHQQAQEALLEIRTGVFGVVDMATKWQRQYEETPRGVTAGIVGPKVSGRMRRLIEGWETHHELLPKDVQRAYEASDFPEAAAHLISGQLSLEATMECVAAVETSARRLGELVDDALKDR
jgi:hypothetical protein